MQKIKQLSSMFHSLFACLMVLLPSIVLVYWCFFPFFKQLGVQVSNTPLELMSEQLSARAFAFAVTMMPVANIMIGVYWLQKLFANFASGLIFSMSNVRIYRNIGITLFCLSISDNLFNTLLTLVMTYHISTGPQWSFGIDTAQIIYVILGGLIWLTSYVLQEAYYLEHEARFTI